METTIDIVQTIFMATVCKCVVPILEFRSGLYVNASNRCAGPMFFKSRCPDDKAVARHATEHAWICDHGDTLNEPTCFHRIDRVFAFIIIEPVSA
jgi:hypothetical protein